jgi:hypothetical protein
VAQACRVAASVIVCNPTHIDLPPALAQPQIIAHNGAKLTSSNIPAQANKKARNVINATGSVSSQSSLKGIFYTAKCIVHDNFQQVIIYKTKQKEFMYLHISHAQKKKPANHKVCGQNPIL